MGTEKTQMLGKLCRNPHFPISNGQGVAVGTCAESPGNDGGRERRWAQVPAPWFLSLPSPPTSCLALGVRTEVDLQLQL